MNPEQTVYYQSVLDIELTAIETKIEQVWWK